MNLRVLQSYWVLGYISDRELPQKVGVCGLEAGLDSEAVYELASLTTDEPEDARTCFRKILQENDLLSISKADAARILAVVISKQIIDGELTPYEGARKIWDISIKLADYSFHDLDSFIYAASEYDSRLSESNFFDNEILKEAFIWVNSGEAQSS